MFHEGMYNLGAFLLKKMIGLHVLRRNVQSGSIPVDPKDWPTCFMRECTI